MQKSQKYCTSGSFAILLGHIKVAEIILNDTYIINNKTIN